MPLVAVQHVRRMRGGAQSHMMRCSDGNLYVVKFRNNPQGLRVLANEMLAARLATLARLPVPAVAVVEVGDWLIDHTPELHVQLAHTTIRCEAGSQFGSKYVVDPTKGIVFDYLPTELLHRVRNLDSFAGILALDKWTCNADGRQAAFWRFARERKYRASFIDQGNCFNGEKWSFPDNPLRGVFSHNEVYDGITGWHSFQPWLSLIEQMSEASIREAVEDVPPEWCGDTKELENLGTALIARQSHVRSLIEDFRQSVRRPFPRWLCAA